MNRPISIMMESCGVIAQIKPLKRITLYSYRPKNKEEAKTILKGNIPTDLDVFLFATGLQHSNIRWNYDESNPYITFEHMETL